MFYWNIPLCAKLRLLVFPDVLVRQLQDHVRARTASYKYPRVIEFVDSLPMTISGKIRRALIRTLDSAKDTIIEPVKNVIGFGKDEEK